MKLTLTRVYRNDKDKDNKPLVFKNVKNKGQPYTKLGVQCQEYGTKWLSGFDAQWNANWKEGDVVEADVEVNGEFLNLKRPDPLADILRRLKALEDIVNP